MGDVFEWIMGYRRSGRVFMDRAASYFQYCLRLGSKAMTSCRSSVNSGVLSLGVPG